MRIKVNTVVYEYQGLMMGSEYAEASYDPIKDSVTFIANGKEWTLGGADWLEVSSPLSEDIPESNKESVLDIQHGGSHYKDKKIQPIEYITANDLDFCQGNIVKYVTRHKDKNGAEDVRKIIHYAQFILKFEYGEEI